MGIFGKLKLKWDSMTTKQKIDMIIDVMTGAGCGFSSVIAGKKLSEGRGIVEKICIRTAVSGLGLAASKVSASELKEAYGDPLAKIIDKSKARAAEEKMKEAIAHE